MSTTRNPTPEQIHEINAQPFTARTVTCHDSVDLDLTRFLKNDSIGFSLCIFHRCYHGCDQGSKIFKEVPTTPRQEEHVTKAANMHACKHHHPVLNERQAAHCSKDRGNS